MPAGKFAIQCPRDKSRDMIDTWWLFMVRRALRSAPCCCCSRMLLELVNRVSQR